MKPVLYRFLFAVALFFTAFLAAASSECAVLTSFYPMYVLTAAVANGAELVDVQNMAEQTAGCLHDYALTPKDVAMIEEADVLVINGGGMEQFLSRAETLHRGLPVIDASSGIEMEKSWEEGLLNAHVWLSPELASRQVRNIASGLIEADPFNTGIYNENMESICADLEALDSELRETLLPCQGNAIISFHEAFNYFAEAYGIEVAGVIAHEPGENPSTREIAETCDLVKKLGIRALFAEPQYPAQAAETISRETGATLYQLNPFVSGDGTFEGYKAVMRENAVILREALTP